MPTLTRTWTSSQNNSCADQTSTLAQVKEIAFDIKTKLKAAGWTVTQSSDAAAVAASDLWIDVGDITRASSGAHSWIVLKSPTNWPTTGKNIWVALDYDTTQDYYLAMTSRGDADWTSRTTSAGPRDSEASTNPFYQNYQTMVPTSPTDCKFHSHYSDQGDFIYYVSNSTSQQAHYGLIISKCTDHATADLFPVAMFSYGAGSTSATFSNSAFYMTNFEHAYKSKFFHYSTGVGAGNQAYGGAITCSTKSTFWSGLASGTTGNDIDGKIPLMPLYCSADKPTGSTGLRGHLTDIYTCHGGSTPLASVGDVAPGTGTITFGCVGGVWVPCSVAPDFS